MNTTEMNTEQLRTTGAERIRNEVDGDTGVGTTDKAKTVTTVTNLLRITYGVVPIVAGLDKFTNILVIWDKYLHPAISSVIPPHTFMMLAGIVEVFAGILVLAKPKIGGYIVAAWLTLIALNLLVPWSYPDVAVRDLVMAIGAFSLARLSAVIK